MAGFYKVAEKFFLHRLFKNAQKQGEQYHEE